MTTEITTIYIVMLTTLFPLSFERFFMTKKLTFLHIEDSVKKEIFLYLKLSNYYHTIRCNAALISAKYVIK